jgi:hypothetical protein
MRAGKTTLLWQILRDRLAQGTQRERPTEHLAKAAINYGRVLTCVAVMGSVKTRFSISAAIRNEIGGIGYLPKYRLFDYSAYQ